MKGDKTEEYDVCIFKGSVLGQYKLRKVYWEGDKRQALVSLVAIQVYLSFSEPKRPIIQIANLFCKEGGGCGVGTGMPLTFFHSVVSFTGNYNPAAESYARIF